MSDTRKLTFKQKRAIIAILTEPSLEAAAKRVGVHVKTLVLWRRNPAFQRVLEEHSQQMFEAAMTSLMRKMESAQETLCENLEAEKASDRIKAAVAILKFAVQAYEIQVLRKALAKCKNLQDIVNQMLNNKDSCGAGYDAMLPDDTDNDAPAGFER
jgi:hypothetical protein